jgi:hypothetical protein
MIESEIFKDIPGYECLYQISNLGRVKSYDRVVEYKNGSKRILKGKFISIFLDRYYKLNLLKKQHYLHRLIALSFIPNLDNKPCVNHKNGIKTDNNIDNLEWVTLSENSKHAYENNLWIPNPRYGNYHGRSKKVYVYDLSGNFVREFEFIREASIILNISENLISRICSKQKGTAKRLYQFRYFKSKKIETHKSNQGKKQTFKQE